MYANIHKTLVTLIVSLLYIGISYAQPKAIGTTYSFSGICISYEHSVKGDSFIEAEIKAELSEVFVNRTDMPGVSTSFTWNYVLKNWTSAEGNEVRMYAGPGIAAGICKDFKKPSGIFLGLKGRIGTECSFSSRNIIISACLAPVLGTHVTLNGKILEMRYYRNGLLSTIMPEVGIRYMF